MPQNKHKISYRSNNFEFRTNLLYFLFFHNAKILYLQKQIKTPFVMTLYPGGGLILNNPISNN